MPPEDSPHVVEQLVANHREFLAFVQRRVGNPAVAEEILQDAFVRSLSKTDTIEESAIGWFYRVLRNAIIDHHRRGAAAARTHEALQHEPTPEDDAELHRIACRCVGGLVATLKPEYATALQRIDVDGVAVKDFATEAGITASNAGVRVFRARAALREQVARACGTCATHGCLDCSCSG